MSQRQKKSERLTWCQSFRPGQLSFHQPIHPSVQSDTLQSLSLWSAFTSQPSLWHSPLLQSDTSSQLPRTVLYEMEVEMYEWYLPINQRWEAPVARNNTVPALGTSDNIQYEGYTLSDGDIERVALEKWRKQNILQFCFFPVVPSSSLSLFFFFTYPVYLFRVWLMNSLFLLDPRIGTGRVTTRTRHRLLIGESRTWQRITTSDKWLFVKGIHRCCWKHFSVVLQAT